MQKQSIKISNDMKEKETHKIGHGGHYDQEPLKQEALGWFVSAFVLVALIAIFAFIGSFASSCSHNKEIVKTTTQLLTTTEDIRDTASRVVIVTKLDSTIIQAEEYTETEVYFTTTEFDSVGNPVKITEGAAKTRTEKTTQGSKSTKSDIVDTKQKASVTKAETTEAEQYADRRDTNKTEPAQPQKKKKSKWRTAFVVIGIATSVGVLLRLLYYLYKNARVRNFITRVMTLIHRKQ